MRIMKPTPYRDCDRCAPLPPDGNGILESWMRENCTSSSEGGAGERSPAPTPTSDVPIPVCRDHRQALAKPGDEPE